MALITGSITNTIERFWFEFSAYLIPGLIITSTGYTFIGNIVKGTNFELKDLYEWSFPESISGLFLLLVISYISGMLISSFVFQILDCRGFRWFASSNGIYRILRKGRPNSSSDSSIRKELLNTIQKVFNFPDIPDQTTPGKEFDKILLKQVDSINALITRFIEENSRISRPKGGYHERSCLAQNLSFVILLISFGQWFPYDNQIFFQHLLVTIVGLLISFLLLLYVKRQALWYAEYRLGRFFTIWKLIEKEEALKKILED